MRIVIILVSLMGVLFSCSTDKKNTSSYIDTKSLFQKAINQLSLEHKTLHKVLVFGDSNTVQDLIIVDWATELRPFVEIDLRKNTYKGRFQVNTYRLDDSLIALHYKALDLKTDLQELRITLKESDSTLVFVKAAFREQNTLYTASKELLFFADSLFTISGSQQVQMGNVVRYQITGAINEGL